MSRFKIADTRLAGLKVIDRDRRRDSRGFLCRLFCSEDLRQAGWERPVVQVNHTMTHQTGALRGMHFQHYPHSEMKMIVCLRGEVFDVAIDLRAESSTFLRWHAERLSSENGRALLIPEGFAHGFQALTDNCELLYLHTASYAPLAEGAINSQDPRVGIDWPLSITDRSDRDCAIPFLAPDFSGLIV